MSDGPVPTGHLVRELGKPASAFSVDDLVELVTARRIPLVTLMHVGSDAQLKALDFAPRDAGHLRDVLAAGERVDGSSLFGSLGIAAKASDITLRPRPATAFLDPFAPHPGLAVLCEHRAPDGTPLPEAPHTLVRRAAERAREVTGVELTALAEIEYFLGRPHVDEDVRSADDHGYHSTAPFVFGEELRREAIVTLAGMGVPIKYAHAEVGHVEADERHRLVWEQHEIELALQPLPEAADAALLTAWVLRNLARRHGLRCSLAPIVREGHVGSGQHVHLSPVVDGRHLGGHAADDDALPLPARALIGGLARSGAALMAFGNRHPTSFVRLHQGLEAPSAVTWGRSDRKSLVRLPIVPRDDAGRAVTPPTVEFRLPDGSAHPHLLLAGIAQAFTAACGDRGLDELLEATRADGQGAGAGRALLPRSFAEVADALADQRVVLAAGSVFPEHVLDRIEAGLRARG